MIQDRVIKMLQASCLMTKITGRQPDAVGMDTSEDCNYRICFYMQGGTELQIVESKDERAIWILDESSQDLTEIDHMTIEGIGARHGYEITHGYTEHTKAPPAKPRPKLVPKKDK